VTASRAGRAVLDGVDLELGEGATAIVGASGSGKSTLLRLLNRLADADSGTVSYKGDDVRALDPLGLRRRVCLVPQLPAPLPGTVADNVRAAHNFAPDAVPEPDVARALGLAGLDPEFADREVDRLSVGEQQRVMLARALAMDPEVLLLDEPTSALDEAARGEVEATLQACKRELSITLVLVTHDRPQAERLADRIVGIDAGRIVERS
jgi:putative ABC transport system ATP-binding protein